MFSVPGAPGMPPAPPPPNFPPVSATIEQMQSLVVAGSTKTFKQGGQFFRDAAGRTRTELGKNITIHDPVAGVTYVLDQASKTGVMIPAPPAIPEMPPPPNLPPPPGVPMPAAPQLPAAKVRDLGPRLIEGYQCRGIEVTIPNVEKPQMPPIVTQSWVAPELTLDLASKQSGPDMIIAKRLVNVAKNPPLDPKLFQPPPDFKIKTVPTPPDLPRVPSPSQAPNMPRVG